jgi:hypothetical protein
MEYEFNEKPCPKYEIKSRCKRCVSYTPPNSSGGDWEKCAKYGEVPIEYSHSVKPCPKFEAKGEVKQGRTGATP